MNDDQKFQFRSCIALCDQAIAPLTQLTRILNGILPTEIKESQDAGDDARIDKASAIQHQSKDLTNALDLLERLKVGIEKYK